MSLIKSLFLSCIILLLVSPAFAQMIEDPTNWKYEVKKKSKTEYQLVFKLTLKSPWHIWSLKPGGDGYEIAPTFTFDKNAKVNRKGTLKESGNKTVTTMAGIDGKVTFYSGNIEYTQDVTVTGPTKITGKHEYQVCNEKMCLPPKEKQFMFDIN